MKQFTVFTIVLAALASDCANPPTTQKKESDEQIKQEVMAANEQLLSGLGDADPAKKRYRSYCEDSLLLTYDGQFQQSSAAVASDLMNGVLEQPHDFTFRIYENTVILSYLSKAFELVNGDTVIHNTRTLKTFVRDGGQWKMAASALSLQQDNFFRPAPKQPSDFSGIPGVYGWTKEKSDSFYVQNGKLYDVFNSQPPEENFAVNDSAFMIKNDLARIYFTRDGNHKVTGYIYERYDGQRIHIPKVR